MSEIKTNDEHRLWEFVEQTARRVESWPEWKKEGWAILDEREPTINNSNNEENRFVDADMRKSAEGYAANL